MSVLTAEDLLAGAATTHRVAIPEALAPPPAAGGDGGDAGAAGDAREVVLRPLVLADVVRLNRAARDDGELASALMLHQALVEPQLSLDQVHRLPAGLADFLLGEVNRISGLSLSGEDLEAMVHEPLARACLVLGRELGWTPDRCSELTVGQMLLYLQMLGRGERP